MRRWFLALLILGALTPAARAQVTDHYTLLMVWMPGLCKAEPDRIECKDLTLRRYDGLNLAFMALQSARSSNAPNTFCYTMLGDEELDRSRKWCEMDQPRVMDTLAAQLKILMPVMRSCQDRALWSRYASCTMYSADDYYARAIKLARSVAGTQMNRVIAGAVGTKVKQSDLVAAFVADFGDERTNAVDFVCRKIDGVAHLLQVRISLTARALTRGLGKEFLWKPTNPLRRSCPENILVDAPPVPVAGTGAAAPAKPAPPPGQPPVPDSAPVAPVETAPLEPTGPVHR